MEQCPSLGVNSNDGDESERDTQESERLTCMDSGEPSFGQNDSPPVLPIAASLTAQHVPEALADAQALPAEQFHPLDQSGQPAHYDPQSLSDSHIQMTGMVQGILPQEPLVDVSCPQDLSLGRSLPAAKAGALEDSTSSYTLCSQASLVVPKKLGTRMLEEPLLAPLQSRSSNTPIWACRLRSCEKIGDSYRGYCVSETELESILTFHKQQTQSVWGTRQSPSPAKPATRLMWKSQYVPYDGIPFVNAGSRAVVMECQYGPRRKGFQLKKISEQESRSCHLYRATCPAR